jgi:L-aspartate oxidase
MRCLLDPDGPWPCRRLSLPAATAGRALDRDELQRAMTQGAGVLRDAASLAAAADAAAAARRSGNTELANLGTVAAALVAAATMREESRGAHARLDFPERDDSRWRARIVIG